HGRPVQPRRCGSGGQRSAVLERVVARLRRFQRREQPGHVQRAQRERCRRRPAVGNRSPVGGVTARRRDVRPPPSLPITTEMQPITLRRVSIGLVGVIALGAAWFFLAPRALGGSTSYVVTHGTSMEPRFRDGDLVIVRGTSDYRVGDVAAYQSTKLETLVLHRIVARDGNRYVFKGDHNSWLDPERPTRSQLVGTTALR